MHNSTVASPARLFTLEQGFAAPIRETGAHEVVSPSGASNLRRVSTMSLAHRFHHLRACRDLLFLLSGVSTHLEHSPASVCGRTTCGEEWGHTSTGVTSSAPTAADHVSARVSGSEEPLHPLPQVRQQRSFTCRTALIRRAASLSLTRGSRRGVHGNTRT